MKSVPVLGDPWLQGGVALISQSDTRKDENAVWYHVMESSPGWPQHELKYIGALINQIARTGHVTNGSDRSPVASIYSWPQLLFIFLSVYLWILSSTDRDAIHAGIKSVLYQQ